MLRVLVVDDDRQVAGLLARVVESHVRGVHVVMPSGWDEFLSRCSAGDRFDLVLVDSFLDGWEPQLGYSDVAAWLPVLVAGRGIVLCMSGDPFALGHMEETFRRELPETQQARIRTVCKPDGLAGQVRASLDLLLPATTGQP